MAVSLRVIFWYYKVLWGTATGFSGILLPVCFSIRSIKKQLKVLDKTRKPPDSELFFLRILLLISSEVRG